MIPPARAGPAGPVLPRGGHAAQGRPGNVWLQWMSTAVGALHRLLSRDVPGFLALSRKLSEDIAHTEFDCESAFNVLAVLLRLRKANTQFARG